MDDINSRFPWCAGTLLSQDALKNAAAQWHAAGKRIVTVNGSFDLLHPGHLWLLWEAKKQGDVLVTGLNSDASVQSYKGPTRPIVPQGERAAMLAALPWVDAVAFFDETEIAEPLLKLVRPQVHVNGSEYGSPDTWVEYATMQEVGAQGYLVQRRPGFATTDLIKKIQGLQ